MKTQLLLLSGLVLIFNYSFSQQFLEASNAFFIKGLTNAGVDWGDFDNDGDLDLIMIGNNGNIKYSRIYTNNIGGNYENNVDPGITSGYVGADASWSDVDNDGDLDYVMTGSILSCSYSPVVINEDICLDSYSIRRFVLPENGLQGVQNGSVDWGDFDNDGDYDLAIIGGTINLSDLYTYIYENVNDSMILYASLTGLANGIIRWVDIDNDRDLDLFFSGETTLGTEAHIYENNNGVFTDSGNSITGVRQGDADFGDYDNDGDLDLALTGDTAQNEPLTLIYSNNAGLFSPEPAYLVPLRKSSIRWGDYDNDGDLDLLAVGDTSYATFGPNEFLTSIYRNDGSNNFSPIPHTIPGYKDANARWADHDNDGDLDFILTGYNNTGVEAGEIYENQLAATSANTNPLPPTILSSTVNSLDVILNWDQGSDAETPTMGLNYNLSVGSSPSGEEIVSSLADLQTGFRRKAEVGNAEQNLGWRLKNMIPGDYFWQVQTIDGAFAGSLFSSREQITVFDPNAPTLQYPYHMLSDVAIDTSLTWYTLPGAISYKIQLDTTDSFTTPILDLSGLTDTTHSFILDFGTTYYWRVQALTGTGTSQWSYVKSFATIPRFSKTPQSLANIKYGQAKFGDFDNDDDLDIVLAGRGANNSEVRNLYENVNNNFVLYPSGLPQNVSQGDMEWGDFDNDNDVDLLINFGNNNQTRLYENEAGIFTDNLGTLSTFGSRTSAWGDHDNDGDLDFAILGADVYQNDQLGFNTVSAGFVNSTAGDLAWGDYDNDGDLDMIMTGTNNGSGYSTRLYRNDGDGFYTEIIGHGMQAQTYGARVKWGDVDQDGDLDVLLSGQTINSPYTWAVYTNQSGIFTLLQATGDGVVNTDWGDFDNDGDLDIIAAGSGSAHIYYFDGTQFIRGQKLCEVYSSIIEIGDYDNDNDLDLLLAGDIDGYPITMLYVNNSSVPNSAPTAPENLNASYDNGTITLSWDPGNDSETATSGLTYNFYFSTTPGGTDIASPMASVVSGKRRIAAIGNANSNTEWVLKDVPNGTYYWSVQTIDNNYDASVFASEQTVKIENTHINELSEKLLRIYPIPSNNGILHIAYNGQIKDVEVRDMIGRKMNITFSSAEKKLDASNLSKGNYLVTFITDLGNFKKEICIVR